MTLIVTPEPGAYPPRVRVQVAAPAGREFASLTVVRDGEPIPMPDPLEQPAVDFYDYGALDGSHQWGAIGATSADLWSTLRDETWPNLAGWTSMTTPAAAVSGGRLTAGQVSRTDIVLPPAGRITSHELPWFGYTFGDRGPRIFFGNGDHSIIIWSAYDQRFGQMLPSMGITYGGSNRAVVRAGTGEWSVTWNENTASLTTTAGSVTVQKSAGGTPITGLVCDSGTGATAIGPYKCPPFKIEALGATTAYTSTATATVSTSAAWLVHATDPTLSVPIDGGTDGDPILIHGRSRESVTRSPNTATIEVAGDGQDRIYGLGPRKRGPWQLILAARTREAAALLDDLVAGEVPVMLRLPAAMADFDYPQGWYSIGQDTITRATIVRADGRRLVDLELRPVPTPPTFAGAY